MNSMNSIELAVFRQRCDRGETFTAEEVERVLGTLETLLSSGGGGDCTGCYFCDCDLPDGAVRDDDVA